MENEQLRLLQQRAAFHTRCATYFLGTFNAYNKLTPAEQQDPTLLETTQKLCEWHATQRMKIDEQIAALLNPGGGASQPVNTAGSFPLDEKQPAAGIRQPMALDQQPEA